MTREEYFSKLDEEHAFLYFHLKPMDEERHNKWINHIFYMIKQSAGKIFNDFDARLKSKDEEIKRLKEVINTSIEEIEYSIKKPQYAEDYLGNAIRFLKNAK